MYGDGCSEFGEKYELMMVEEQAGAESTDGRGGPRVSFVIVPSSLTQPNPTTNVQVIYTYHDVHGAVYSDQYAGIPDLVHPTNGTSPITTVYCTQYTS